MNIKLVKTVIPTSESSFADEALGGASGYLCLFQSHH